MDKKELSLLHIIIKNSRTWWFVRQDFESKEHSEVA